MEPRLWGKDGVLVGFKFVWKKLGPLKYIVFDIPKDLQGQAVLEK